MVSVEKSVVMLIFIHIYVICIFSFGWLKVFLFLTGFKQFDYDVAWYNLLCLMFLELLRPTDLVSIRFRKLLASISSNIFFLCPALSSPSGPPLTASSCLKLCHSSQMFCLLVEAFFSLSFSLYSFSCCIFKFTNLFLHNVK